MNKVKIRFFIYQLKFKKGNKKSFFVRKNKKFKFNMSKHSNLNFFKSWDFLFQLIH